MVAPAHITAPTAAELEEIRKVFSGGRGALQIITGDLGRRLFVVAAFILGAATWAGVSDHVAAVRREAYAAGQVNGACRMWREALSRDPLLAFPRSSGGLDHACAPVLTAAR